MRASPLAVRVGVGVAVIGAFALLRYSPWSATRGRAAVTPSDSSTEKHETLTVGFLPVT